MINVFVFVIYAIAAATASLGLMTLNITDIKGAILFGLVALLLAMQLHGALLRRRERSRSAREIAGLKRASQEFVRALEETHLKIEDVKKTGAARASEQTRKIVSELQMLEGLMREFSARITEKAREVVPEEDLLERRTRDRARSYLDTMCESDLLETLRA